MTLEEHPEERLGNKGTGVSDVWVQGGLPRERKLKNLRNSQDSSELLPNTTM